MSEDISHKLIVAISSQSLYPNFLKVMQYLNKKGVTDYACYQRIHELEVLKPGVSFSFGKKILSS